VWSAATDLGMVAVIHVGNTYADYGGWADIGWDLPGGGGVEALVRLSSTKRHHVAEDLLSSLVFGGAFHRHSTLTVMLEEMGVAWIPPYVDMCERQSRSSTMMGDWPFELSGGDLLRRNVRFTPLPGFNEGKPLDVVAALPEMALFSSDYPHQEGNADPINAYGDALQVLEPHTRERFMGENAADAYARMGDPL
jgi:predicted TIM-barrel fold metal-dependent hydrolase